jgi:NAD(P)-dependent dehydrogenase (short-subunit alcohol dehydrogenase family)
MKTIRPLLIGLLFSALCLNVSPEAAAEEGAQRAVLVTGASSGIGRNIAEKLAANGHFVYAGARKEKDLAELDALENIKAVRLDVTLQGDIDAAVELVRREGRGLYGVVNNAGVGYSNRFDETDASDIDFVFGVNVYGPFLVNKAFMPLLIESEGRTATIGSIAGFLSGQQFGVYSMSKFAVEAYTEALAAEVAEAGVKVSVIEPGSYKSRIRETGVFTSLGKSAGDALSEDEQAQLDEARERNAGLKEPDEVSDAVMHALFAPEPRLRYMVTPNEGQADITVRAAMRRAVQLNGDQPYAHDRDELVAMLDELLAQ